MELIAQLKQEHKEIKCEFNTAKELLADKPAKDNEIVSCMRGLIPLLRDHIALEKRTFFR